MSNNPLSTMVIDYWYKILPVIGTITLIASLTVDMKVADNPTVMFVSIGVIFIGIGEWINHPLRTGIIPGAQITTYNRINTFWGNIWDLIGAVIIVAAILLYNL